MPYADGLIFVQKERLIKFYICKVDYFHTILFVFNLGNLQRTKINVIKFFLNRHGLFDPSNAYNAYIPARQN